MELVKQVCRKCLEFGVPVVTKEWSNPTRRLHWCEKPRCIADSERY